MRPDVEERHAGERRRGGQDDQRPRGQVEGPEDVERGDDLPGVAGHEGVEAQAAAELQEAAVLDLVDRRHRVRVVGEEVDLPPRPLSKKRKVAVRK